jgi:hypothetical protein
MRRLGTWIWVIGFILTFTGTALAKRAVCGNGVIETGEQCEGQNLQSQTCQTLGFTYGTLSCNSSCKFDTSGCTDARFVDNGDGTVTDNQSKLQWEKKVDGQSFSFTGGVGDCLHCVGDIYTWRWAMGDWLSMVNGLTDDSSWQVGFAGFTDWRIPTIEELQTILDTSAVGCGVDINDPCINPIFGPTVLWNYPVGYWSSSISTTGVWRLNFVSATSDTVPHLSSPDATLFVRAVRDRN